MFRRLKQQAICFFTVWIIAAEEKHFFKKINLIDSNILQQNDLSVTEDLLFGSGKLKDDKNNALLSSYSPWRDSNTHCFYHKQPVRLAITL